LTFVLIFILVVSFLENLIEVDCGEGRSSLSQVAQSRWILLPREYFFSAWGSDWHGVGEFAGSRALQQNGFETQSTHL
jgi:hypothetical protein